MLSLRIFLTSTLILVLSGTAYSQEYQRDTGIDSAEFIRHCDPNTIKRDESSHTIQCKTGFIGFLVTLGPDACPTCATVNSSCTVKQDMTIIGCTHTCKPDKTGDCANFAAACVGEGDSLSCEGGECTCKSGVDAN